jgi:hypothetical protein
LALASDSCASRRNRIARAFARAAAAVASASAASASASSASVSASFAGTSGVVGDPSTGSGSVTDARRLNDGTATSLSYAH